MNQNEIMLTLGRVGAIMKGHFVYASGFHGSDYFNKDSVYAHTIETSRICNAMAEPFAEDRVEVVAGAATGGIILSWKVADRLTKVNIKRVYSVYAEKSKDKEKFIFQRGYDKFITEGKRVLLVEDILNRGGTAKKMAEAVKNLGGTIVGLAAMINRGGITSQDIDVPRIASLVEINLQAWPPEECPLCRDHIPINTDVGHG